MQLVDVAKVDMSSKKRPLLLPAVRALIDKVHPTSLDVNLLPGGKRRETNQDKS